MSDEFETFEEPGVAEFKALMADPAARQAFVELKQKRAERGARRSYESVIRALAGDIWVIREEVLQAMVDFLAYRMSGGTAAQLDIEAAARRPSTMADTVAVIPIHGPIVPKMDIITALLGGTAVSQLRAQYLEAMASPQIKGIVLDIDSPGGQVSQIPELATEMRSLRGRKPVVAVANTMAASGAYWLAAQADEVVASPSSLVGSIGARALHIDVSKAEEMEGIKTTIISAGKFKAEEDPSRPLTDDAFAHIKALVDNYYGMFVSDVAKGRGVSVDSVRNGYGEGAILSAKQGLTDGLVDRIGTLDEVVREMLRTNRVAGRVAADAQPLVEAPHVFRVDRGRFAETPVASETSVEPGELPDTTASDERAAVRARLAVLSE